MSELRIRVKPIVKEKLLKFKEETGLSINYIVNWALVKFMIMEQIMHPWEYEKRKNNTHYEYINKLPDDLKYCDINPNNEEDFR